MIRKDAARGNLFMLLTAVCWSTIGIFIRGIHQSACFVSASTALVAFVFIKIFQRNVKIKWTKFIVIAALCQFVSQLTFILANQLTQVANAIVLQYSSIVFTLIYKCIGERRRPRKYQIAVIFAVLIGMAVFFMGSFSLKGTLGNLFAIISGVFFGLQFYLNEKPQADTNSSIRITYIMEMFLFIPVFIRGSIHLTDTNIACIFLYGIISVGMAGICFAKGIKRTNSFSANLICMSEIIFSPLWTFLFLGEKIANNTFLGAFIMIGALIDNMYMEKRYAKQ